MFRLSFRRLPIDQRQRNRINGQLQLLSRTADKALISRLDFVLQSLYGGDSRVVKQAREDLELMLQEILNISALTQQVSELTKLSSPIPKKKTNEIPIYCISSTTLAEAYAHLTRYLPRTKDEPEWMLAVSGLKQGSLHTLESLIDVRLSSQSAAQASFDMQDFTRIVVALHEHGQALHAIFHSHRFKGAPHPSSTDQNLQRILEEGGYPAIQAVFSEDGYVRFFARRQFSLEVHGKGVVSVEQQNFLYRIVQFNTLPHPSLNP